MIQFDVQAVGLDKQIEKLAKFDRIQNKRLAAAMEKSVITVRSNVVPLVPVGVSGRLRGSIGTEVITEATSITGRVGSSLKDEVYPQVMEEGRRPGAAGPPWEALVRWVHLKGIAGSYSVKTHRRTGSKATQADEDEQAARMIARAIHRHGIQGKHFMREGFGKARAQVLKFFNDAAALIVGDLTNDR